MKSKIVVFSLTVSFLLVIGKNSINGLAVSNNPLEVKMEQELIVPTINEIRKNGYPVNENGESYGIDDRDNIEISPDLILAENKDGLLGYIKASDIDLMSPATPEEAKYYQSKSYYVNMYLQDGQTQIGTFYIAKGNTQ